MTGMVRLLVFEGFPHCGAVSFSVQILSEEAPRLTTSESQALEEPTTCSSGLGWGIGNGAAARW